MHLFGRSDSGDLFLLRGETYAKKNAIIYINHEYGIATKFEVVKFRVTHNRFTS
jgi:hypothetical protein